MTQENLLTEKSAVAKQPTKLSIPVLVVPEHPFLGKVAAEGNREGFDSKVPAVLPNGPPLFYPARDSNCDAGTCFFECNECLNHASFGP